MSDQVGPRVDVEVGDVRHSQLIFGDHNTIQTPEGTKVTVLQVGERPVPRLRPVPVAHRPDGVEIVGRDDEVALAASARAGTPVQLYAQDGSGKTSLLKFVALRVSAPAEGVVFEVARRRTLDEIQAKLYAAFWECDVPFIPSPAEVGDFLADREALLVLDDCCLDRSDLDTLLDSVPGCTVVLASEERTLWSRGTARALEGLDPAAALQLLERELGRALAPGERTAAEAVVARLGGSPQSLVEAAALIEDEKWSIQELADDPAALAQRTDPSALSELQRRMLEILSALDGAALGVERISALTDIPDALPQLRDLERRGWVKAGSPRYRIARPLPQDAGAPPRDELAKRLLEHLVGWSRGAAPSDVAVEAEAIEGALELGAAAGRWEPTLELALAAEGKLTVAGSWSSCRRVLNLGLRAANAVGDESARAHVLHQLGSQSLCLGEQEEAVAQLTHALQIRERLGDQTGAELTRHNLEQMRGGGLAGDGGRDGGWGPRRPRMWIVLGVLGAVAAIIIALAGGSSNTTNTIGPTGPEETTVPPSGEPPAIAITSPEDGATYDEGSTASVSYTCTPARDAEVDSCEGAVDGVPIDSGATIKMSAGDHQLAVTAVDDDGRESEEVVGYSVSPLQQADEDPPTISIASPTNGEYVQGEVVLAEYECSDEESEPVSCIGEVQKGAAIDTETPGPHSFTVTATDSAGNGEEETVEYEVVTPSEPGGTLK